MAYIFRFLKRDANAASFIAKYEYIFHIWIIKGVAFILFFIFYPVKYGIVLDIVFSYICAVVVGFMVQELVFTNLVIKKHSGQELKALWLDLGGFSE